MTFSRGGSYRKDTCYCACCDKYIAMQNFLNTLEGRMTALKY